MYKRILVPIDGSETGRRGLREAITLATEQKATLCLLHVTNDFPIISKSKAIGISHMIGKSFVT